MINQKIQYRIVEEKTPQFIMFDKKITTIGEICYIKQRQILVDDFYGREMWVNEEFVTKEQYLEWRIMNE